MLEEEAAVTPLTGSHAVLKPDVADLNGIVVAGRRVGPNLEEHLVGRDLLQLFPPLDWFSGRLEFHLVREHVSEGLRSPKEHVEGKDDVSLNHRAVRVVSSRHCEASLFSKPRGRDETTADGLLTVVLLRGHCTIWGHYAASRILKTVINLKRIRVLLSKSEVKILRGYLAENALNGLNVGNSGL